MRYELGKAQSGRVCRACTTRYRDLIGWVRLGLALLALSTRRYPWTYIHGCIWQMCPGKYEYMYLLGARSAILILVRVLVRATLICKVLQDRKYRYIWWWGEAGGTTGTKCPGGMDLMRPSGCNCLELLLRTGLSYPHLLVICTHVKMFVYRTT